MDGGQQVIDFRNTLPRSGFLTTGVPQGSIIGPLLSLINVNDIPVLQSTKKLIFADDQLLILPVEFKVLINDYAKENHVIPHLDKT